jgi:acetyl-CoA C-acetyltransferase
MMAVIKALALDLKNVTIYGRPLVPDHPIGASGACILVTLIYNLKQTMP